MSKIKGYNLLIKGVIFFGGLSSIFSFVYLINAIVIIIRAFRSFDVITILFNINYFLIESVLVFYAIYLAFILINALKYRKNENFFDTYPEISKDFPTVTVLMPVRGISPSLVDNSIKLLLDQSYPSNKYEILLATNNPENEILHSYRELAEKNNIKIMERDPTAIGFKAGVMNQALNSIESKYIIVFDADHVANPNLIEKLVRAFESLAPSQFGQTAFIQAKSTFISGNENYQKSISLLRAQVFEVYYRAKQMWNGSLFNGFSCCFQTRILKEIDGFPLETLTENNGVSIKLLLEGYYGRYIPSLLSIGDTPTGLNSQLAQLWRWNNGTASLLRKYFWSIISNKNLTFVQKYDLICYLSAPIILIVVGVLFPSSLFLSLIFNLPIIRPEISGLGSLFLIIPGLFVITETIITLTSIAFEESHHNKIDRMKHIIISYFLSLTIPLFIITASFTGVMKPNNALNPDTKWNINYNKQLLLSFQVFFTLITGIVLIKVLSIHNEVIFLYLSLISSYFFGFSLSIYSALRSW
ncbi:MAG: glycosyltransferase family 2 protein [Candidatus Hodarchaeales archaeon]|jgi:cellulose synthase/poly-beta-1,6-N-acetylglucosamine synthase-like glycosyltransferase